MMPHKFNAGRRHKFAKKRYRVTNWAEYNESLRRRGDLTIWTTDEALVQWTAPRRKTRGGLSKFSNMAITMGPTLGVVYKLPLRQTQGLMRSIAKLLRLEVPVPGFSTLSRQGLGLTLPMRPRTARTEPVLLVVDSTGQKIFGEGEWLQSKHKTRAKRKSWRKLHLGLNLISGEIICADLTRDDVGDPAALPDLLDQVDAPVIQFLADGAYDGAPTRDLLKGRFVDAVEKTAHAPSTRDQYIAEIQTHGRLARQVSRGYNQRSRGETLMCRWKGVIGSKLKARSFENQQREVRICVCILNKMTELGRPEFEVVR
jgi:hypothetical protein